MRGPLALAGVTAVLVAGGCSSTSVLSLSTGECLASPSGDTVTEVDVRDCDSPHALEVVGTFDLDTDTLPAQAELTALADRRCTAAFTDYVGVDPAESRFDLTWMVPTESSWGSSGDRTVTCLAGTHSESLTSSVRDSGE